MASQDSKTQPENQQQQAFAFVPVTSFQPQPPQGQPPQAYPFLMSASQPYYQPAPFSVNGEPTIKKFHESAPLLQNNTPTGTDNNNGEGCKKSCRWGRCCKWTSKQPLGENYEFATSLLLSNIFPVISFLIIMAMESTQLSRIGTLYGNANFFLMAGIGALFYGSHMSYIGGAILLLVSLVLYVVGLKYWCAFLFAYKQFTEANPAEKAKVVSDAGCRKDYWISFFISFFIPVLGSLIRIACNKSLQSRFGTLKGLAYHLIVFGALTFGADHGMRIILGLLLIQFSSTHFRKTLICATGAIFC